MIADHPTREERYAAVLAALNVSGWRQESDHGCDGTEEVCAVTCPVPVQVEVSREEMAAALVAADPAPAQPDAALSDDEQVAETVREVLTDHIWWVPPDGGPAACWSANDHDDTPCGERFTTGGEYRAHVADLIADALAARAAQPVPAPEVSRGAAEVMAWLCRFDGSVHRRGVHHPGDLPLVVRDALGGERGEGA